MKGDRFLADRKISRYRKERLQIEDTQPFFKGRGISIFNGMSLCSTSGWIQIVFFCKRIRIFGDPNLCPSY